MLRFYRKRIPRRFSGWFITDPKHLREIARDKSLSMEQKSRLFNRIMRQLLIGGVWKTTSRQRLASSTGLMLKLLPPAAGPCRFLDIGCADGSSSWETHQTLRRQGVALQTCCADRDTFLLSGRAGLLEFFYTGSMEPFLCRVAGIFMLRLYPEQHRDFLSKKLAAVLRRYFARKGLNGDAERISLKNPLLDASPDLSYERCDVFEKRADFQERFDVVRCANLLNLSYFSEAEILSALKTLSGYLKEGGYLIVSKSDDQEVESGVLAQKKEGTLQVREAFNQGSEISRLIGGQPGRGLKRENSSRAAISHRAQS